MSSTAGTPIGVVHRNIARADRAAVDRLAGFGVATIHEAMGRSGLMQPYLRPIYAGAQLCGPAVTVLLQPGDNWMLHVAVEQVQAGDVVVAACTAASDAGFFGELLATSLRARGARGLVIDGGVRDVDALERLSFPVFATDIVLRGASKERPGSIGSVARVGDVDVEVGDWVVGDRDGVVVIRAAALEDVLAAGRSREAKEAAMFEELRGGATTVELLGLDTSIVDRG